MPFLRRLFGVFLLSSIGFIFESNGQTITGKIVDQSKKPIPYSSINALQSPSNQFIKSELSDEEGNFIIELEKGNYLFIIRSAGFISDSISFSLLEEKQSLGIIVLHKINTIETIEVTAEKSSVEFQIDKKVYNIGSDLNNQGASASEVLENIPSVTVDNDGNVSLRGNTNVRILVDGKLSGFASSGEALKQLRSENIDRIEVITNASAKHDAQGDAGIINIVLKKNKTKGLSGSVGLRAGYFPELGADLKINYKNEKIYVFGSYSGSFVNRIGKSTTYQKLNNSDTAFVYKQLYSHDINKMNHQAAVGLDYSFDEKHMLSSSFSIKNGLGNNKLNRIYEDLDFNDVKTGESIRKEKQREMEDLMEASLNFNKRFMQNKGEWTIGAQWYREQDVEKSLYNEHFQNNDEQTDYSYIQTLENNLTAQSDLTIQLPQSYKIETGIKLQGREMNNSFQFGQWQNGDWYHNPLYNNTYRYNELVLAGYVLGAKSWKHISTQLGLRVENSNITTLQKSEEKNNRKNFLDLFPSAAISYTTDKKQTIQLNYSRRINRPGQWELIPISRLGDNRERMVGNTAINPEYTHSIEASFLQLFRAGSIYSSLYYKNTDDKVERISSLGSDGIVYITPYNAAIKNTIGLELNGNYTPIKWLRITTGFNLYYDQITSKLEDFPFKRTLFSWTNRTSVNLAFPKIIKAQIAYNYQAPTVRAQGKMLSVYYFDLGVSRDFLQGDLSLGLNIKDIFNTRRWRFLTDTPEIYTFTNGKWRQRTILLVLSYRFNQKKKEKNQTDFNLLNDRD